MLLSDVSEGPGSSKYVLGQYIFKSIYTSSDCTCIVVNLPGSLTSAGSPVIKLRTVLIVLTDNRSKTRNNYLKFNKIT